MPRRKLHLQSFTARSIKRTQKELRKLEPLAKPDAILSMICPGCGDPFRLDDIVTLVPIGPGLNPESCQRAREGRPYTAVAVPVHWACATGGDPPPQENHE